MRKISILGSTGSIGTQSLDIIRRNRESYGAEALVCGSRVELLAEQIEEFSPKLAVTADAEGAARLQKILAERGIKGTDVLYGDDGVTAAAELGSCDTVINALVGVRGLVPTYRAIQKGKTIALANKETLVAGGELIMGCAAEKGVEIVPIDSEHSAIYQCLQGNEGNSVRRILLTASGGPFRGYTKEQLDGVTREQALKHPKWTMGAKITIDSATLMNKGLEVIEAHWLFGVPPERIQVLVHPQSIVHSMVEYEDRSVIAQLGQPDMRIPISYALSHPARLENDFEPLDPFSIKGGLTFEPADTDTFRCLAMAYEALAAGGSAPVVLNAANEVLVGAFLADRISFTDIQRGVEKALNEHEVKYGLGLEDIIEIDADVRRKLAL